MVEARKSGFQLMLGQRSAMNWTTMRTLLNHGRNREAEAIVESFQAQMLIEEEQYQLHAA